MNKGTAPTVQDIQLLPIHLQRTPTVKLQPESTPVHQQPQGNENQAKNQKWTEREHALYVIFLEKNRDKIKSKLIRRSNSFYKEMSKFIGNKTGVQCRSHHQKYEGRYKYPHKIIKGEKERIDPELYSTLTENCRIHQEQANIPIAQESQKLEQTSQVSQREVFCQTDLCGVDKVLVTYPPSSFYHPMLQTNLQGYRVPPSFSYNLWGGMPSLPFYWQNGLP